MRVVSACVALVAMVAFVAAPLPAAAQKRGPLRTGKLEVKVSVEGASIFVDGAEIAKSPMTAPVTLAVGAHTLKVTKPGHAEFLDTVKISPNELTSVDVDLVPFNGVVNVGSDPPGADVYLDGKIQGQTPARLDVDPGEHVVRLELDGYGPSEQKLQVTAGQSYDVNLKLIAIVPVGGGKKRASKPIYKKWWFWAAGGAVAVGVTAIAIGASGGNPLSGADKVVDVKF